MLGRIDFCETIEKDFKKAKTGKEPAAATPAAWPWQGVVDNLQQAHQELNIILDFITHVSCCAKLAYSRVVVLNSNLCFNFTPVRCFSLEGTHFVRPGDVM